jgi:hypothetical protein
MENRNTVRRHREQVHSWKTSRTGRQLEDIENRKTVGRHREQEHSWKTSRTGTQLEDNAIPTVFTNTTNKNKNNIICCQ